MSTAVLMNNAFQLHQYFFTNCTNIDVFFDSIPKGRMYTMRCCIMSKNSIFNVCGVKTSHQRLIDLQRFLFDDSIHLPVQYFKLFFRKFPQPGALKFTVSWGWCNDGPLWLWICNSRCSATSLWQRR